MPTVFLDYIYGFEGDVALINKSIKFGLVMTFANIPFSFDHNAVPILVDEVR